MTIKIPETYMGKPIKGAMEIILAEDKPPATRKNKNPPNVNLEDLDGFIYVPSINLYVAKEKTLHGKNWLQAHRALQRNGNQMITIRQYIDFIQFLQGNNVPDKDKILDEILTVKNPWRSEWLDAKFTKKNGDLYISYNHRLKGNRLEPDNTEKLEDCVRKNAYIDLTSPNSQGLPTRTTKKKGVYYFAPVDGAVAGFFAYSDWASLFCGGNLSDSNSSLGVRAARPKI